MVESVSLRAKGVVQKALLLGPEWLIFLMSPLVSGIPLNDPNNPV